jgi:photosystem II stability/assembly factor-like uncharacterized protein
MRTATCGGRRAASSRRRTRTAVAVACVALCWLGRAQTVAAATPPASAIGNQAPLWIAVSPGYWDSRMAAALATAMGGCSHDCTHLWVTRDGGVSWRDHRVPFDAAHIVVLTTGSKHEAIVTESSAGVQRTDDDGATWRVLGPAGVPAVDASGALMVAVPNGTDYVIDAKGRHDVAGSGGRNVDLAFARAEFSGWLATVDRKTGNDVVMHCDLQLQCSGGAALPGDHSSDVTLTVANRERDVVARTTTGLYRSSDGGRSFSPVPLPLAQSGAYTTVAAADVEQGTDTEIIYVALLRLLHGGTGGSASTDGGVYATIDGGVRWRAVGGSSPLSSGATAVAASPDGRVLAGYVDAQGQAGLMCFDAGNAAWRPACSPAGTVCSGPCSAIVGASGGDGIAGDVPQQTGASSDSGSSNGNAPGAVQSSGHNAAKTAEGADEGPPPLSIAALVLGLALAVVATPISRRRRRPQ